MRTSLQARRFAKTAVAWFAAVGLASAAAITAEDGRWALAALMLVGAVAAGALAAWAWRSEAEAAAGPVDSPSRRARRPSPVEVRTRLAVALGVGLLFALALQVMPGTGDAPTALTFVNRVVFMTAIYGAYLLWQGWAVDPGDVAGDAAPDAG